MFKFAHISSSFVAQATSGVTAAFRTPRLDFTAFSAFIEKLKPGYQEKMDRQKLAAMFQLNNEVRETATNRVYTVYDVKLGCAFLIDAHDNVQMVDWHTSAGGFKGFIADDWELVQDTRPQTAAAAEWELVDAAHA